MVKTARDLLLNSNGKRFTVRKDNLPNKTNLLFNNPALLGEPEYAVQSIVDPSAFSDFVKFIQEEQIDIRADNFGCEELSSLLSGFHPSGSGEGGGGDLPITQDALKRIYANEEGLGQLAQEILVVQAENARLVSDLDQEKGKFAVHAQRFEAQQRQISRILEADRARSEDISRLWHKQRESESSQQRELKRTQEVVSRLEGELKRLTEQSKREERDFIGREVSRLSRAWEELSAKSDRLTRLFEIEHLYRRGCEALYGTNGYDERGVEKSFRLGLSQLKAAADLGHSDTEYVYGRCLYLGTGGEKNFAEAAKYFRLSVEQRNS
jgi:hypothetical protein